MMMKWEIVKNDDEEKKDWNVINLVKNYEGFLNIGIILKNS